VVAGQTQHPPVRTVAVDVQSCDLAQSELHSFCVALLLKGTVAPGRKRTAESEVIRELVIGLRKKYLSVYDIHYELEGLGHRTTPSGIRAILQEEGFARLPRRDDEERPSRPHPLSAAVANVRDFAWTHSRRPSPWKSTSTCFSPSWPWDCIVGHGSTTGIGRRQHRTTRGGGSRHSTSQLAS